MAETLMRTFDQEMSVRWGNDPSDVGSISTGTVVSPDASTDSLAACEKREYAYKEFKHQKNRQHYDAQCTRFTDNKVTK